ncbi:uncharacterized protein [Narcine bancroftii]|uniref:uncharacterized protein isoform X2 n=1 Tax=Narcine bancroftii TaxID=1343680 RepID=UPI003831336B
MDTSLKPGRFEIDQDATRAREKFHHWLQCFEPYMRKNNVVQDPEKIDHFMAFLRDVLYSVVREVAGYQNAVNLLKAKYYMPQNTLYARHQLHIRKQQAGESVDVFALALKGLYRDCACAAITAEAHHECLMLDAFISGLESGYVRRCLLETPGLTFNAALQQAKMLLTALQGAKAFEQGRSAKLAPLRSTWSEDSLLSLMKPRCKSWSPKCYFCSLALHAHNLCPERQDTCTKCRKEGHWARVCRARESISGTCGKQKKKKKKKEKRKKHPSADTKQSHRHKTTMLSWRVNDSSSPTSASSTSESYNGSTSDERQRFNLYELGASAIST